MKGLKEVKVFAPATVANLVCAFDILGVALETPGDEVVLRLRKEPGIKISKITGDGGRLPLDPERNVATIAMASMMSSLKVKEGVEVELIKKMPISSGLGSSAASSVAGVFALNVLLGEPLSKEELLPFALEGEKFASKEAHADNVAPSLFGGVILVRSISPLEIVRISYPESIYFGIVHPKMEIETKKARQILPQKVPLKKAVIQWGNIAGLIAGLMKKDLKLISASLSDVIIEPVRSKLIPNFERAKEVALKEGALAFGISGSGPSVFALCSSREEASFVAKKVSEEFEKAGLSSDIYISGVNEEGPKIVYRRG